MKQRKKTYLFWLSVLLAIVVVVWLLLSLSPVRIALSRLRISRNRVVRVEIFEQDHCCCGPKKNEMIFPKERLDELFLALHQVDSSSVEGGCKCGTNGIQILIHMQGKPSLAQITCTGCQISVLHDGNGSIFAYFKNRKLYSLIDEVYKNKAKAKRNVFK